MFDLFISSSWQYSTWNGEIPAMACFNCDNTTCIFIKSHKVFHFAQYRNVCLKGVNENGLILSTQCRCTNNLLLRAGAQAGRNVFDL